MITAKVSLDQWRVLQTIIDRGSYAQAAEALHRSQSSVSYAISRLEQNLGLKVLQVRGRKAELTQAGKTLLQRSRLVMEKAIELEQLANIMEQGWEPEIRLTVDVAFPTELLLTTLKRFEPKSRGTRILLNEVVLSGAEDALATATTDLAICHLPNGYLANELISIEFIAVAHQQHALHQLQHPLSQNDLKTALQVVISDSGMQDVDKGWLSTEHRWTVTRMETALATIEQGLGFGWLPRHLVAPHIAAGKLIPLNLAEGQSYRAPLHMIFAPNQKRGPATQMLAKLFHNIVQAGFDQEISCFTSLT